MDVFFAHTGAGDIRQEPDNESLFELSLVVQGPVLYILVRGELEFHHTGRFNEAVEKELDDPSRKHIIIHMGEVSFVDSTGLACLVNASQTVKGRGGQLHLAGCTPFIIKTLEITRLKRVFAVYETFSDAYDAVNEPGDEAITPANSEDPTAKP
ncbi:MAG: STAS domain-containing protein [Akkermansiaceae bacterium]|nr:STAS domain-containing protein [Armatimonadota bacterium]